MTDRNPPGLPPPTGRSVDGLASPEAASSVSNTAPNAGAIRSRRLAVRLLAAFVVVALVAVLAALVTSRDNDGTRASATTTTTRNTLSTLAAAPPPTSGGADASSTATTESAATAPATSTTTTASTTASTTTVAATTTTASSTTSTTTVTTTTSTAVPTTTAPPATVAPSTDPPTKELVVIAGRKGACRFGSNCLIAGFSIWSFETNPTSFVCEFSSGKRFTISFTGSVVETACYTAAVPDSITIEVDGVRSETITTDDLEPSA